MKKLFALIAIALSFCCVQSTFADEAKTTMTTEKTDTVVDATKEKAPEVKEAVKQ